MIAFESRASTVLYNLLRSHEPEGAFLVPANVCPIVPMVFNKARRPFELVDISPRTLCIDHDAILDRWSATRTRPAGLLYVRTYGVDFDTADIFAVIKSQSPDALIVDDRCLCPPRFGSTLLPDVDAVLYSTGYAKFVDIGFGGYGVLRDGVPYGRTASAYNNGDLGVLAEQYKHALSARMPFTYLDSDWLDTSIPLIGWESYRMHVEREFISVDKMKKAINAVYASKLPAAIQLPDAFQSWRFNIMVRDKAAVLEAIRQTGLFASGHYDSLAGVFGLGSAPNAEALHRHVINLFNDRNFSSGQAERLADLLEELHSMNPSPLL